MSHIDPKSPTAKNSLEDGINNQNNRNNINNNENNNNGIIKGLLNYMTNTLTKFNQNSEQLYRASNPNKYSPNNNENNSITIDSQLLLHSSTAIQPVIVQSNNKIIGSQSPLKSNNSSSTYKNTNGIQNPNNPIPNSENEPGSLSIDIEPTETVTMSNSKFLQKLHTAHDEQESKQNDQNPADYVYYHNIMQAQQMSFLNNTKSINLSASQPMMENNVVHPNTTVDDKPNNGNNEQNELNHSKTQILDEKAPLPPQPSLKQDPAIPAEPVEQAILKPTPIEQEPISSIDTQQQQHQHQLQPASTVQEESKQESHLTINEIPFSERTFSTPVHNSKFPLTSFEMIQARTTSVPATPVHISAINNSTNNHSNSNSHNNSTNLINPPFAFTTPSHAIRNLTTNTISTSNPNSTPNTSNPDSTLVPATPKTRKSVKLSNFQRLLDAENTDLSALAKLSWNGVPSELRYIVWPLLLGYLPANMTRRNDVLNKRRLEYRTNIRNYYQNTEIESSESEKEMLHQIRQDLPRTNASINFYKLSETQSSLERILYIFAIRHPACGYVQGMNDLLTAFYSMFYTALRPNVNLNTVENIDLSESELYNIESDSYHCLSLLIEAIQENYTFAQPGIQRSIYKLTELTRKVDLDLYKHLEKENVQFLHFSFRWMNCLLMREFNLSLIMRLFDTYIAEICNKQSNSGGLSNFHLYVCLALLLTFAKQLKTMPFHDVIPFLQKLPTAEWQDRDIELLLSQAFLYQSWFGNADAHLST